MAQYEYIKHYTTTIAANGDPADIYYPAVDETAALSKFPIVLLLQGALVDKADYSNFAAQVASEGFVVVVPNHERTGTLPNGEPATGLLPEQQQVNDVLGQIAVEDANPISPISGMVDTEKLGLLGHSFGGLVGLGAIQEKTCVSSTSSDNDIQQPKLKVGVFYGAAFGDPATNTFFQINNEAIPIGLILGERDGALPPFLTEGTYEQIIHPPKALIKVKGANHFGITNEDNLMRDPNRPILDQATSTETIARWSTLFLQAHLQGNTKAFDYIYHTGNALDQNVSVISHT